jgi:hypothetical protein
LLKLTLTLSTLLIAAFSSVAAFCDEETLAVPVGSQSDFELLLNSKPDYRYSVFTNPVTILTALPLLGGRGLQLGGEFISPPSVASFFYLGYTTYNFKSLNSMSERQQTSSKEDNNSEVEEKITFRKSETLVANIGARYFFRPNNDGWFLGSLVRYEKEYVKADYNTTKGRITRVVAGPQGHGGHRWIWRHGGFIDFFTGAFVLAYENQTFSWETDDEKRKESAQKAYEKRAVPSFMRYVVPELNITMGYLFK